VEDQRQGRHRDTVANLDVQFRPGQVRRMSIATRAPLGREANREYIEFVSQDLSRWRGAPDYLEIRFSAPGRAESRLAALEPRPNNVNPHAVQWSTGRRDRVATSTCRCRSVTRIWPTAGKTNTLSTDFTD